MYGAIRDELKTTLGEIRDAGLYKNERELASPQSSHILAKAGGPIHTEVLNFCANNYLGLADHPALIEAAATALHEWGFGMASVRFICGTQTQHTLLERRISALLHTEATILYSSCFDANGGLFEVLLDERDAVISDELNHASIIDGVRLCKARRLRYRNRDMADLEAQLAASADARRRLLGDVIFLANGFTWACYNVMGKRMMARHAPLPATAAAGLVGFAGLLPFAAGEWLVGQTPRFTPTGAAAVAYTGLLVTVVGFLTLFWAYSRVRAAQVAISRRRAPAAATSWPSRSAMSRLW